MMTCQTSRYLCLPLCSALLQITPGSKAALANLCAGDIIVAIEGASAADMLHCEAQNKIKEATSQLCLTVERLYEAIHNRKHKQVLDIVKSTHAQMQ